MGKKDWYLPSKQEMIYLIDNLFLKDKGNFKEDEYWVSTKVDQNVLLSINLKDGYWYETGIARWRICRPVRSF